ncbi:MAG: hypothetical protein ACKOQM_02490 [Novosphingobium sp.]
MTNRKGDRASDIQRSTMAAWYLSICFAICLAGGIWLANLLGVVDFGGSGYSPDAYKLAAKEAAHKAAEQQLQARIAAEEEARNIAEDSTRLLKAPGPTPPVDPAESAQETALAPAPQAAATAAAKATPQ